VYRVGVTLRPQTGFSKPQLTHAETRIQVTRADVLSEIKRIPVSIMPSPPIKPSATIAEFKLWYIDVYFEASTIKYERRNVNENYSVLSQSNFLLLRVR
jgi:hypothetical protein